jgi:predicted transcriptional regulator
VQYCSRKCLSLKQPYAELLVSGMKTIEIRKWNTKFRGQFLVHASKNIDEEACKRLKIDQAKLVTGAIVGEANLCNVTSYRTKNSFLKDKNKHFASSNYEKPKYGFLVNQPKRFVTPIPIRGKLGFFNVEINGFISGPSLWDCS